MSADNGVYIMETLTYGLENEFRVAHLQSVDNYLWDLVNMKVTDDEDWHLFNARRTWTGPAMSSDAADRLAEQIHDGLEVCEYGIVNLKINRIWSAENVLKRDLELQIALACAAIESFPKFRSRNDHAWNHDELIMMNALSNVSEPSLRKLLEKVAYGEIRPARV